MGLWFWYWGVVFLQLRWVVEQERRIGGSFSTKIEFEVTVEIHWLSFRCFSRLFLAVPKPQWTFSVFRRSCQATRFLFLILLFLA